MGAVLRALLVVAGAAAGIGWFLTRKDRGQNGNLTAEAFIIQPQVNVVLERRDDGDFQIRWSGEAAPVSLRAGSDPDSMEHEIALQTATDEDGSGVISGLGPAARHYLEVAFPGPDGTPRRFVVAERVLSLEGAANFRDIGGYPTEDGRRVRWGQVYRAGSLADLTESDVAFLRAIDIRLVCDLRSAGEVERHPSRVPAGNFQPALLHLPLTTEDPTVRRALALLFTRRRFREILLGAYTHTMIDNNAAIFGEILRKLADPANLPAVIHCTAGKDRTGVAVALLLRALEVPDELVIADYTLSNLYYDTLQQYVRRAMRRVRFLGVKVEHMQPLLVADAAIMQATLDHVRQRYGSVRAYLRDAAGVSDETIERLRALLLE
jgi:protein-tyrosine phosphatase